MLKKSIDSKGSGVAGAKAPDTLSETLAKTWAATGLLKGSSSAHRSQFDMLRLYESQAAYLLGIQYLIIQQLELFDE